MDISSDAPIRLSAGFLSSQPVRLPARDARAFFYL